MQTVSSEWVQHYNDGEEGEWRSNGGWQKYTDVIKGLNEREELILVIL